MAMIPVYATTTAATVATAAVFLSKYHINSFEWVVPRMFNTDVIKLDCKKSKAEWELERDTQRARIIAIS